MVTITVESDPQEVTLLLGTGKKIDLDSDGIMDLNMILIDLSAEGEATLQIEKSESWINRESKSTGLPIWVRLVIGVILILGVIITIHFKNRK
jgi:hypothetical protein